MWHIMSQSDLIGMRQESVEESEARAESQQAALWRAAEAFRSECGSSVCDGGPERSADADQAATAAPTC